MALAATHRLKNDRAGLVMTLRLRLDCASGNQSRLSSHDAIIGHS
jgi:hypothetical protein